ncbi:MAG: tetratricopeptide repeat protein [bacterium]
MTNKNIFKAFIFTSIILFFISSILAGCAPMEPDSIHILKAQVKKLNKKTAELSRNNVYLEKKLHGMQLNLANNGVKISSLNAKIRDIYGRYEVESHNLGLLQKRFREYRLMVNKELEKLLTLAKVQPILPEKTSKKAVIVKKVNSMEYGFKKAVSLYNKKNFADAVFAFGKFINKYPQSNYTADAMFYKASANFYLKKYPVSILELHKFSQIYPKNSNVPMAIYLQGAGFLKVSDPSDASILFRQVISRYPGTKAAELSKQALNGLSK